jgi:lysophospholipase L1-like esterase
MPAMLTVTIVLLLVLATAACAMPAHKGMPIEIAGDWQVKVGPGQVTLDGRAITLAEPVVVSIAPVAVVSVRDEETPRLPMYDEKTGPWRRGLHPKALLAQECVCTGLLVPGSLKVKAGPGEAQVFEPNKDVRVEEFWTGVGRVEGGPIGDNQKVWLDYDYVPCRLDSIVMDAAGKVKVVAGTPAANMARPPTLPAGETAIARVWLQGPTARLSDLNLYPIEPETPFATAPVADTLLPKTLGKLRKGEKVLIVAWGDSVTAGSGCGGQPQYWYQNRFGVELHERFPQSEVEVKTAGWGGRNSRTYMDQPRGAQFDFVRDVLEPKPDLVVIEFVNDSYLSGEALTKQYDEILQKITGNGSEIIFLTPHLVRPDWLKLADPRVDDDPRPYVQDLRKFAAARSIALADGSARWCRLWRQGIPYIIYEANWINHPEAQGLQLFVDALMALFPDK